MKSNTSKLSGYVVERRLPDDAPRPKVRKPWHKPYSRQKIFYVYLISNVFNSGRYWGYKYEPAYVGIGNLRKSGKFHRAKSHFKRPEMDNNAAKGELIQRMLKKGVDTKALSIVAQALTEKQAHRLEMEMVYVIGRKHKVDSEGKQQGPLTNLTAGGEGTFDAPQGKKSKTVKRYWSNKSDEDRADLARKVSISIKKFNKERSSEDLANTAAKRSKSMKRQWKTKDERRRKAIGKAISKARREKWAARSQAEKDEILRKTIETKTRNGTLKSTEKHRAKIRRTCANRTQAERSKLSRTISRALTSRPLDKRIAHGRAISEAKMGKSINRTGVKI